MIRAAVVVTVLLLGLCPAHAIPCWMVRKAVAPIWCGGRGSLGASPRYSRQGDPDSEAMLQVISRRFVMGWPPAVPNLALAVPSSE
jgi:hypothetical protein